MKWPCIALMSFGWLLGSKQTSIDGDVTHWVMQVIYLDAQRVEVWMPPDQRPSRNPRPAIDSPSRTVLDLNYDYGNPKRMQLPEFEIQVSSVQLKDRASAEQDLDSRLTDAYGRPIGGPSGPRPETQLVKGRAWIHYENLAEDAGGYGRESYATLVDETTALMITGWYWEHIRKDPTWLASRRSVLKSFRDQISMP